MKFLLSVLYRNEVDENLLQIILLKRNFKQIYTNELGNLNFEC